MGKHKVVEWFWSYVALPYKEGRAAPVGHGFGEVSVGRLREIAWEGWRVETFHADKRGAGAVRVPARPYVLQPHRPAFIQLSARPGGRVRRRAGPAARRGVFDGLIPFF